MYIPDECITWISHMVIPHGNPTRVSYVNVGIPDGYSRYTSHMGILQGCSYPRWISHIGIEMNILDGSDILDGYPSATSISQMGVVR